eukprot:TRINITY_DN4107_c0_g1_i1.p1 TRINITY_DN4107_c0_g1~~TRINITY_DN4107_c0_g1_i1.p1  ORF type:complete len:197 (+),score=50.17 TRINITY_DN4107_c0_g1_i1:75-665(+)
MSLSAQKLRLKAMMRQNYQHLSSRELDFLNKNFLSMRKQAALFSGFLVVTVTNLVVPEDTGRSLKAVYFLVLWSALAAGMVVLVNTTCLNVWGPGLALRGQSSDSIVSAVNGLRAERPAVLSAFGLCIFCFELVAVAVSWMIMEESLALATTIIIILGMSYTTYCTQRMHARFRIDNLDKIRFENDLRELIEDAES